MSLTKDEIFERLSTEAHITMVTIGKNGPTSRTMTFGFSASRGIYLLTHKGTEKLASIEHNNKGVLHLAKIIDNVMQSYDISISGDYEICDRTSPNYKEGFEILAKHNPSLMGLYGSKSGEAYELLLFKISEIRAWSYVQALNGENKTIIRSLS